MFSCEKDNIDKSKIKTSRVMSFSRALEIVRENRILLKDKNVLQNRDPISIVDTLTFYDGNTLPAVYIINYVDDGDTLYQIIHADENVYPLIGYGEGRIISNNIQEGLECWLNDQIRLIEYVRENNLTFNDYITDIIEGLIAPREDPNPCEDCNYDFTKSPLITSIWGQGCFYNTLLGSCMYNCGHELTGCVATAMGQIINYWEEPSGDYDFGLILDSYNSSSTSAQIAEVSQLMKDIGDAVDMDWGCSESSASTCDDAPDSFKDEFDYASANDCCDFNSWSVRNEINNYRPVMFRGETSSNAGHAWVCDGYREKCVCYPEGNYNLHYITVWFHFNWGWNGSANGWYLNNSFDGLFTSDQSIVTNIHP